MPQQLPDKTHGESNLALQFSETLKANLAEVPSGRPDQSEDLRAKRDELSTKTQNEEIQEAVERAVISCDAAMAANKFDHCLHSLDEAEKQHPGNGVIAAARIACEFKRGQKATQLLRGAFQSAQKHLRNKSARLAEEALREAEYALPYAALNVRDDWKRLKAACEIPQRARQPVSKSEPRAKRRKAGSYAALGLALAAGLLVVGEISYHKHRTPAQPDPVPVNAPASAPVASVAISTDMEINASPWARVVSVQDKTGMRVVLPDGDSTTPLRLDAVASGTYKVTLRGPDDKQQTVECRVSASEHLCSADVGSPSVKQVLRGERP
jgi:serine/threonine-protein kinase